MSLERRIQEEINRLSSDHDPKTINLINNVLHPMLHYIKDHKYIMAEIARISGKHIT